MANLFTHIEENPYITGTFSFVLTDQYTCNYEEDYITSPTIAFANYTHVVNDTVVDTHGGTITTQTIPGTPYGFYLAQTTDPSSYPVVLGTSGDVYIYNSDNQRDGCPNGDGYRYDSCDAMSSTVSTNVPVFMTYDELHAYVHIEYAPTRRQYLRDHALNYGGGGGGGGDTSSFYNNIMLLRRRLMQQVIEQQQEEEENAETN